jgi:hypothetical protein
MLAVLLHFMERAEAAVEAGIPVHRLQAMPVLRQLQRLGEEFGEEGLRRLQQLPRQIDYEFDALESGASGAR